jgi:hypothetical protein
MRAALALAGRGNNTVALPVFPRPPWQHEGFQLSSGVTTAQNSSSDIKKPGCGPDTRSLSRSRKIPPGV